MLEKCNFNLGTFMSKFLFMSKLLCYIILIECACMNKINKAFHRCNILCRCSLMHSFYTFFCIISLAIFFELFFRTNRNERLRRKTQYFIIMR